MEKWSPHKGERLQQWVTRPHCGGSLTEDFLSRPHVLISALLCAGSQHFTFTHSHYSFLKWVRPFDYAPWHRKPHTTAVKQSAFQVVNIKPTWRMIWCTYCKQHQYRNKQEIKLSLETLSCKWALGVKVSWNTWTAFFFKFHKIEKLILRFFWVVQILFSNKAMKNV